MPPKKTSKKPAINIQRVAEQRLLDSKLIHNHEDRTAYLVTIAIAAGILVGLAVLAYLYFSQNPVISPSGSRQIIVPEAPAAANPAAPVIPSTATTTAPQNQTPSKTPAATAVPMRTVLILATPTGFLNVRQGAGTNTAKIAQVRPGETYELVSQDQGNGGWYQIRLDANRTGWVSHQYATVK